MLWHREHGAACGSRHSCALSQSQPISSRQERIPGLLTYARVCQNLEALLCLTMRSVKLEVWRPLRVAEATLHTSLF